jgi:hypothetical protein
MFTTFTSGLLMMMIPPFFSSLTTFITALWDSFSDFAPVQTILPVLKISVAVLGLLSLNTSPGNRSGRYSTPGCPFTTAFKSTFWFKVADATTFSIIILALVFRIKHRFLCEVFNAYYKALDVRAINILNNFDISQFRN